MSEEAQAAPAANVALGLQDISAMVQIIDVVTQRGALRGDELVPVGTLRQKLIEFLQAAQQSGQKVEIPGVDSPDTEDEAESDAA